MIAQCTVSEKSDTTENSVIMRRNAENHGNITY